MSQDFIEFAAAVEGAGFEAIERTAHHAGRGDARRTKPKLVLLWQIKRGEGPIVNFWPTTGKVRVDYRRGFQHNPPSVTGGAVAALAMSMAELDHFWIANVIYLAFGLSALLGYFAKIAAYRRGFQQW